MTLTAGPSTAAEPARAGRREWTALGVLMLPLLLVSMDVSVLYFAIPSIAADLRPGATQQLWILDMYGFVLAGLLVTMGSLGDRVGRRKLVLFGAALFGAASIAAAYAHSPGALIGARALLGVAGACLMPSTLALIRTLFQDPAQRAKAVTLWTTVMASGIPLGPVVSGALLEHFWWGSVFLINLPAMALLLVLAPLLVSESKEAAGGSRFDFVSAGLSLVALLPVIYGIKELAKGGWAPLPALAVAFGVLLGLVFVRRQLRLDEPMIDLRLVRTPAYGGSLLVNLLAMAATVGFAVFLTQYLQSVLGQSPLEAALWSLVPTGAAMVAAPVAAVLAQRVDRAYVMGGGFVVSAAGFGWLVGVERGTPFWVVLVGSAVYVAGLVSAMTLANELALGAAPPERAGVAAAVLEAGSELGGALGMAVLGAIGAAVYTAAMPSSAPAAARETLGGALGAGPDVLAAARGAFVEAMSGAAVGAALLMLLAAGLSLVLLRRKV
ncbi:MFS transporter [Streptomyces sp. NRRL B-24572]|uniref:MFS transporter n=1 Tax=Streptomyces sp. NRRL B-24572 TaxID=1962156 RepID=UPI000A3982B2|nr:MFS transporter [Streptomyces sp. NRRL B-24572]